MKKNYILAVALAIMTMASCSDNDFVGDQGALKGTGNDGAIAFNLTTPAVTRAGEKTGADAAKALDYAFVVGGFKGATSVASNIVFDNYNVVYPKTASTSNTTGWEYVGLQPNALATIAHESTDKQTIKYWDYSQAQYDFIAYSLGNGGATATAITQATATSSTGGAYTISGTTAQLGTVHIADLVTIKKDNYSNVVSIPFRSLLAKVRIGFYETIPGYSINDIKFYTSTSDETSDATSALYASSATLPTQGTYTIYFPTVNSVETYNNEAHVAFGSSTSPASYLTFGDITGNYTAAAEKHEAGGSVFVGRQSNQRTWTGSSSADYYTTVLPYEEGTALTLKVDYTLLSVDGTGETITVKGATAVVPAIYAQWKPNYAYTYIFKISDNTNGKTDETQTVEGLHPITFDAVEVSSTEDVQETVTTVATPSITTYQHVPAVNASAKNEYVAGTVYAMVMNGGTLLNDLKGVTSPAKDAAMLYTLSGLANPTEADVMDALNMYTGKDASGNITGLNKLVLTKDASNIDNEIADEDIPGPDGKIIAVADGEASKLTVSVGTYAYVYTVTQATTTTTDNYRPIDVTGITDVNGYYTYDGSTYTQITTTTSPASGTTYYAKYTANNQVYAVKVIKVVAAE